MPLNLWWALALSAVWHLGSIRRSHRVFAAETSPSESQPGRFVESLSLEFEMKNGLIQVTRAWTRQTPAAFALSPVLFGRIGVWWESYFKLGTWLGVVNDSEGKAHIIVPLSKKVGTRATTHITGSWRSLEGTSQRWRRFCASHPLFFVVECGQLCLQQEGFESRPFCERNETWMSAHDMSASANWGVLNLSKLLLNLSKFWGVLVLSKFI